MEIPGQFIPGTGTPQLGAEKTASGEPIQDLTGDPEFALEQPFVALLAGLCMNAEKKLAETAAPPVSPAGEVTVSQNIPAVTEIPGSTVLATGGSITNPGQARPREAIAIPFEPVSVRVPAIPAAVEMPQTGGGRRSVSPDVRTASPLPGGIINNGQTTATVADINDRPSTKASGAVDQPQSALRFPATPDVKSIPRPIHPAAGRSDVRGLTAINENPQATRRTKPETADPLVIPTARITQPAGKHETRGSAHAFVIPDETPRVIIDTRGSAVPPGRPTPSFVLSDQETRVPVRLSNSPEKPAGDPAQNPVTAGERIDVGVPRPLPSAGTPEPQLSAAPAKAMTVNVPEPHSRLTPPRSDRSGDSESPSVPQRSERAGDHDPQIARQGGARDSTSGVVVDDKETSVEARTPRTEEHQQVHPRRTERSMNPRIADVTPQENANPGEKAPIPDRVVTDAQRVGKPDAPIDQAVARDPQEKASHRLEGRHQPEVRRMQLQSIEQQREPTPTVFKSTAADRSSAVTHPEAIGASQPEAKVNPASAVPVATGQESPARQSRVSRTGAQPAKESVEPAPVVRGGETTSTRPQAAPVHAVSAPAIQRPRGGVERSVTQRVRTLVLDQIVRGVRLQVNDHSSHMRIVLEPETLGEVLVNVTVERGAVAAKIDAVNPETRAIIESSLPQLQQAMVSSGLAIDRIDVGSAQSFDREESQSGSPDRGRQQSRRQEEDVPGSGDRSTRMMGYNTLELTV